MTMRHCVYKDCDNFISSGMLRSSFTLFQFPKDPARRKLWMHLGEVDSKLPANSLFMCSEHFDAKKYMSINNRRTILVGAAVPVPYDAAEATIRKMLPDSAMDEESCEEEEEGNEEDLRVESTTIKDEKSDEECNFLELDDGSSSEAQLLDSEEAAPPPENYSLLNEYVTTRPIVAAEVITEANSFDQHFSRKRKTVTAEPATSSIPFLLKTKKLNFTKIITAAEMPAKCVQSSKVQIQNTTTQQQKTASPSIIPKTVPKTSSPTQVDTDGIDERDLIDARVVTTFIFKGEEYVQMPKEHYEQEKLQLLLKLKRCERLIRNVQQQVNAFE